MLFNKTGSKVSEEQGGFLNIMDPYRYILGKTWVFIGSIPVYFRILCILWIIFLLTGPSFAVAQESTKPFETWLEELRREAMELGITARTISKALEDLKPIPRIIELDRRQPEMQLTFEEYMERVVPESRVKTAIQKYSENSDLLRKIEARFGVQSRFIVALWGIESDFGRRLGGFPTIGALATLAYDGKRGSYFKKELLEVLRIIDAGYVSHEEMIGSWAGAMGQFQFMPSTIKSHWIDYNGNGRLDIWQSPAEAMASAANYLSKLGWRSNQSWGRKVKLQPGFNHNLAGLVTRKSLNEWQRLGVLRSDGAGLPNRDIQASLVIVKNGGPAFLVYENYRHLLNWNRSTFFAVAVGYLADRIEEP